MNSNPVNPMELFDEDIIVMSGKVKALKKLTDGVVRIMVEIDPHSRNTALLWFNEIGVTVAVGRFRPEEEHL